MSSRTPSFVLRNGLRFAVALHISVSSSRSTRPSGTRCAGGASRSAAGPPSSSASWSNCTSTASVLNFLPPITSSKGMSAPSQKYRSWSSASHRSDASSSCSIRARQSVRRAVSLLLRSGCGIANCVRPPASAGVDR